MIRGCSRACQSYDSEFNVAAIDSQATSVGAHGTMVKAIVDHRYVRKASGLSRLEDGLDFKACAFPLQLEVSSCHRAVSSQVDTLLHATCSR